MKKRYMHLGVGSALLILGTSVYGADFSKPRLNPFVSRFQRAQTAQEKPPYPDFNAEQIGAIINAGTVEIKSASRWSSSTSKKRVAITLYDENLGEIKVSSKTESGALNSIKKAIAEGVINRTVSNISVSEDTEITVHPEVKAIYNDLIQAKYEGSTSKEEERKTRKEKKGQLLEYLLCRNGVPIQYMGAKASQMTNAKLILSVTSTPQGK